MKRDIKSIILLLATQCMINLGEVQDPISKEISSNLEGAELFIDLLEELKSKTDGNLTDDEKKFLVGVIENLKKIYNKKQQQG